MRGFRLWLILIIGLAAGLRLGRLDLAQFQSDEATWIRLAEDLVRLGRVPLEGPLSSQGIPAAPHFVYFLAPIVAVDREPIVATAVIGGLNVLAVAGVAWLGWHAFGPVAGVVSGLLFASEPSAVFYARKIWGPDLIAPMGVLLLVALERGVISGRKAWAAASLPIVTLGTLLHFAFIVLTPLLLAPILVLVRARGWRGLGLAILVSLLVSAPYLIHQVQTGWEDVKNFRYYASSVPASLDRQALDYSLGVTTGFSSLAVADVLPISDGLPDGVARAVAAIETGLLALAVVVALTRALRGGGPGTRPERLRLAGLMVWLVLPVLATTRHSLGLHPQYYVVLYPAPFLLIGAALQTLSIDRRLIGALVAGACLVALVHSLAAGRLLAYLDSGYEPCYGAPLRSTEATAQEAVTLGGTRAVVENEDGDADSIAYLLRPHFARIDLAGVGAIGIDGQQPGKAELPVRTVLAAAVPVDLAYPPGVRLTRVSASDDALQGGRVRVAARWQVDGDASYARPLVWQVQLTNADNQVVHRASGLDHVPASLRGESVLSWFTLDTPREIGAPPYQAHLRLVDADRGASIGDEWVSPPFGITQTGRCR